MNEEICCPKFDPKPWDGREFEWKSEKFVKDHVKSVFYVPINFGGKITKNVKAILDADAKPKDDDFIVIAHNKKPFGCDIYIKSAKDVPNAENATISEKFICKVFEGAYGEEPKWIKEMHSYVAEKGKKIKDIYTYYTTCPKCIKKYGKNYVVIMAKIG